MKIPVWLKRVVGVLALALFVPVLLFVLFAVSMPNCGESSDAVVLAKSLSSNRLARLYEDMRRFQILDELPPFHDGYRTGSKFPIPEEFIDLDALKVRPDEANIMLEGCFDHYVYLRFCGLDRSHCRGGGDYIELSYGEWPVVNEVIWRHKGNQPDT